MKIFRKSIAMLLCISMLMAQMTVLTFADETVGNFSMEVSNTTVEIGDEITVTLSNSAMLVSSVGVKVRFDTTLLECTEIAGTEYPEYPDYVYLTTAGTAPLNKEGLKQLSTMSTVSSANNYGVAALAVADAVDTSYSASEGFAVITFVATAAGEAWIQLEEESTGTDSYLTSQGTYLDYQSITITAAAADTYDVTYMSEDGQTTIYTETVGEGSYPVYAGTPEKADSDNGGTSYTFLGWSTTQGNASDIVTLSDITKATTLYAVFGNSTNYYTVTFDPQNGDATTSVVTTVGTDVTPITSPTKADTTTTSYTFAGWSTETTGTNYITNWSTITSGTVYAIYTATAKTYTVTFSGTDTTIENVNVGGTPSGIPDAPDKGGDYTFSHWSLSENGVAVTWADLTAGTYTVYAVYTSEGSGTVNQAYTITTTLDKEKYRSGDTITATVTASSANATNIGGYQMDLSFTDSLVDYTSIELNSAFVGAASNYHTTDEVYRVAYFPTTETNVALTANEAVTLFTVTYTVNDDVSDTATFSVSNVVMMEYGYNGNDGNNKIVLDTATIIDTVDITLTAGNDGSVGATTEFTLDSGDTLADLKNAAGYIAPTASDNYVFSGWAVSSSTDTILTDSYGFTADTELVAVFVPGSFAISVANDDSDNATVTYETGVDENGKATYYTDVTFTVAATGNYIISDVAYYVTDGASGTLTADSGTYTISGANITGEVTITVSAVAYYEITFGAGTGSTLTETTLYAKAGNSGLYASVADLEAGTTTSVPTPVAYDGYRLGTSNSTTAIWSDGTNDQTTAWFETAIFTADTDYTVNTVQTWNITFAAGNNGSVSNTDTVTYDTGAEVTVVTVTPASGYKFNGWTSSTNTALDSDATSFYATKDVTYTANFIEGTYAVTYPTQDWLDISGASTATYNTNLTFTLTVNSNYTDDYTINTVTYTIGEGNAVTLVAESDGSYKVPGSVITDDVAIGITSTETFTVSFTSDENGSLTGTTSYVVDKNDYVSAVPTTVGNTGYTFSHWTNLAGDTVTDPTTVAVTADETYTANFVQIEYTFSATNGTVTYVSGYDDGYATYGTAVTFTISSETAIITGVSLNSTPLEAVDGVYTIPGNIISGDTTALTLTVSTFTGTISFIDLEDSYMAKNSEAAGRQIMVLDAGDENDSTYKLADGTELYWSSEYSAYVAIVGDTETAQTLSVGMTSISDATTNTIDYSGDVNGDGSVNVIDAIIVNDILHGTRLTSTSDAYLFRADVDGSKVISASDITVIENDVLGITND